MIIAEPISTQLRLVFYDGEDTMTGDPVYRSKSFNNIKIEATDEQLFIVAEAFEGLQTSSLYTIERRDHSEIREE